MVNNTVNLCNSRSSKHYVKWAVMSLFTALCCIPVGFYPFLYGPFAWGPFFGSTIGTIALVMFVRSILVILTPGCGKLGKSVRLYSDGTINTGTQAVFAMIDKDMEENGRRFGYVWVGSEWVLGGEAMRIDRIRGIFSFKIWKGKQYEYAICLVDDRQNVQVTNLTFEKQLDELHHYLIALLPKAATGGFKDYMTFIAKDKDEMEAFNEEFLHPKRQLEDAEFVFTEADGIPTSLATSEKILKAVDDLQSGQRIRLAACPPPASERGSCIDITCYRLDEEGQYTLMAYFRDDQDREMVFMLRLVPVVKVRKIMLAYFEKLEVPDLTAWEDQSHLLYEEPPMEDYVLYVDDHCYDHITYDDVQASLENLKEGKCRAVLLRTPGWQNGYMEVTGREDDYVVEVAGFDKNHEICGYRTHTVYGGHVTYWLSEYYHHYKYPEIRDGWEDVSEEVRKNVASSSE